MAETSALRRSGSARPSGLLMSADARTWVVLHVGRAYTMVGIQGEPMPRHAIPTPPFTHNTARSVLQSLVHDIYFELLLVNPYERRVALVTDPLGPSFIRDTLEDIFLTDCRVPAVAMVCGL